MGIEKLFGALNISASGLSAQRKKLDIIASNIANANTTRTEDGQPYRRRITVMKAKNLNSFEIALKEKSQKLAITNSKHLRGEPLTLTTRQRDVSVEASVQEDPSEFRRVFDPTHPDADEDGYVYLPNVNMVSEMVDMISASRSYEANVAAIDAAKKMARAALDI